MIRDISEKHINKRLNDRFGRQFKVETYVMIPGNDYWRFDEEQKKEVKVKTSQRDIFFYYLLVANIILLLIVGALVYKAVIMVYFG